MLGRPTIAALRAARKSIKNTRRTVFEAHAHLDRAAGRRVVADSAAAEWLAELDAVIVKIEAALAEEVKQAEAYKRSYANPKHDPAPGVPPEIED